MVVWQAWQRKKSLDEEIGTMGMKKNVSQRRLRKCFCCVAALQTGQSKGLLFISVSRVPQPKINICTQPQQEKDHDAVDTNPLP